MAADNIHIVQKISAVMSLNSEENHPQHAEHLKESVRRSVKRLIPLFNRVPATSILRIDSLSVEINLSETELEKLEEKIDKALIDQIEKILKDGAIKIQDHPKKRFETEKLTVEEKYKELIIHFLKTGQIPWWTSTPDLIKAEQWLDKRSVSQWMDIIKPLVRQNPAALHRYVNQWPVVSVNNIIKKLAAKKFENEAVYILMNRILEFLNHKDLTRSRIGKVRGDLQQMVLVDLIENQEISFIVRRLFEHGLTISGNDEHQKREWFNDLKKYLLKPDKFHSGIKKLIETLKAENLSVEKELDTAKSSDEKRAAGGDSITVQHAGVVILHNYLPELFRRLGYLEEEQFRTPEAKERAVCAIHYLASGQREFREHEMVISKFLCSWPMDKPVSRFLDFSNYEMEECDNLLGSVIGQWKALKNTSSDGLRKNFLQREGLIKQEAFGWNLYVEKLTQDILLDQIPWGFSVVKLPWMDEMLTVQWSN